MKFKSDIEAQAGFKDAGGSPGTVNQILSSTVTGTAWIDPSTIVAEAATVVVVACKNTSGATIAKGTPVYQTGTVGATATIEIAPADALISANKLPAIGLLQTALNNNGLGFVVITGALTNFTTSPIDGVVPTTGDKVFVKSGGGLTLTKPTGEGNGIQNMGLVGKVATGSAGSITVSSIMRTNDVPNLPTGRIWVGDGNTLVSDTVYIDEPNLRLGIGTTVPRVSLDINGATNIDGQLKLRTSGTTSALRGFELTPADHNADSIIRTYGSSGGLLMQAFQTASGFTQSQMNFNPSGYISFDTAPAGTNHIERLRIISNGNVGIGTTSPTKTLHVYSSGNQMAFFQGTSGGAWVDFQSGTSNLWSIGARNSAGMGIYNRTTSSDVLTVLNDGNVGIGTISPATKLHITGITRIDEGGNTAFYAGNYIRLFNDQNLNIRNSGGSTVANISVSGNSYFNGGNVGIGTTSPLSKLHVSDTNGGTIYIQDSDSTSTYSITSISNGGGNLSFDTRNSAGTYVSTDYQIVKDSAGANYQRWFTQGSERMRITSTGNVGIGTTSPTDKLTVNGTFRSTALWTTSGGITQWGNGTTAYGTLTWDSGYARINAASGNRLDLGASAGLHMSIATSGNVGIGTTSPGDNLQLNVANGKGITVSYTGTTDGEGSSLSFKYGGNNTYTSAQVSSIKRSGGGGDLVLSSGNTLSSYSEIMRLTKEGNVGIGTTTPYSKFTTLGALSTSTSQISIVNSEGGHTILRTGISGISNAGFSLISADVSGTNQNTRLVVNSTGNVGIGTTSPAEKLEVVGNIFLDALGSTLEMGNGGGGKFGSIGFNNSTNNVEIKQKYVNGGIIFNTNTSSERMRITSTGNVGIGTTIPTSRVHSVTSVSGPVSYDFRCAVFGYNTSTDTVYNNPVGIAGRVLTSGGMAVYGDALTGGGWAGYFNGKGYFSSNVGIGTTSPLNAKLVVSGAGASGAIMSADTSGTNSFLRILGDASSQNLINWQASKDLRFATSNPDYSSFSERMRISANGNVCIGTTYDLGFKLNVVGAISRFGEGTRGYCYLSDDQVGGELGLIDDNDANIAVRYSDGTYRFGGENGIEPIVTDGSRGLVGIGQGWVPYYTLDVNGQVDGISIYASDDIVAYSDQSVKENIRPIDNVIERIEQSRGVLYDRIDSQTKDNIGFIAQELEVAFPELVVTNPDGTKAVKYQNAVAVLFEAIKEQQKQINEIKEILNGITK